MLVSTVTSETDLGKIFQVILENAQKLFPGSTGEQFAQRCPGCSEIVITLPPKYKEGEIVLDTDQWENGLGVRITTTFSSDDHPTQHNALLKALTAGLPDSSPPESEVGTASIFDNL